MADKRFFVRTQGKILGPFSLAQLATLRDRGQFARFHEVSEDRRTWLPATTLGELFPTADAPATYTPVAEAVGRVERVPEPAPAARADGAWYFGRDDKQFGPYAFDVLRQAAATGQLTPTDLVWQQGMPGWVPAQQVGGLRFGQPTKTPANRARARTLMLVLVPAIVLVFVLLPVLYFFVLRPSQEKAAEALAQQKTAEALAQQKTAEQTVAQQKAAEALAPQKAAEQAVQVPSLSAHASAEEITRTYLTKVYVVQAEKSAGSGMLLARDQTRGLIVTNHHVLTEDQSPRETTRLVTRKVLVKNSSQLNLQPAQIVAIHRRLDLALLLIEVAPEKSQAVPVLRRRALRQGEEAVALGNPLGLPFFTSSGIISSTSSAGGFIWTTCPLSKGNSGGPLFLKRRGLLVGINTLKLGDIGLGAENLNAAIPAEEAILSLHGPRQESWTWNEGYRDQVVTLAKLVPLEE